MTPHALLLSLALVVAVGCATNPATGRRQLILMSEAQEVQIGRESDAEIRKQMGLYPDENLQRYVAASARRLAATALRVRSLPWTFAVVDEPAVNAFALPGGFIYVTRGILPFLRDEAELAGVLGHEVGHVDARHSAEAYSKQLGAGPGAGRGRRALAADRSRLQRLAGAGLGVLSLKSGREAELEIRSAGRRVPGWRRMGSVTVFQGCYRRSHSLDAAGRQQPWGAGVGVDTSAGRQSGGPRARGGDELQGPRPPARPPTRRPSNGSSTVSCSATVARRAWCRAAASSGPTPFFDLP